MRKLLLISITALLLSSSFAYAYSDNWGFDCLDNMFSYEAPSPFQSTMNLTLITALGPELSVASVITGATNILLGENAAKFSLIEKAAPSATAFLENEKMISEDFIIASYLLIEEKGQALGRENVEKMISNKEITMKTLAQEIINH